MQSMSKKHWYLRLVYVYKCVLIWKLTFSARALSTNRHFMAERLCRGSYPCRSANNPSRFSCVSRTFFFSYTQFLRHLAKLSSSHCQFAAIAKTATVFWQKQPAAACIRPEYYKAWMGLDFEAIPLPPTWMPPAFKADSSTVFGILPVCALCLQCRCSVVNVFAQLGNLQPEMLVLYIDAPANDRANA